MNGIQKCVVAAAGAALTLGLTACGGGEERDPHAALKAARQKTAQQNSYKTKQLTKDAGGEKREEHAFSREPDLSSTKSWGPRGKAPGRGSEVSIEMISTEKTLFARAPRMSRDRWLRTDRDGPVPGKKDPGPREAQGELPDWLAALGASKGVTKVGEETVGGKPATHFKGTVVLDELDEYKGDAIQDDQREHFTRPRRISGLHEVDIDIWVGRDDLPLKARESGKGSKGPVDTTEEYTDYGVDPKIQVPAAKDTMSIEEYTSGKYDGEDAGQRRP
ncbi:putative lipoprotein [Streptomyces albireticuli]|uniref:Putative lipoprotein n=1 Tax=Streptomyces albireticuli TaxID=1940 RepID=A0A1Z2L077_9ACTN|nr:hypothetical protein [Streptomyces albireticuli]ARZ67709.1 putative lipoprotein [Streptomyces albireticuli]